MMIGQYKILEQIGEGGMGVIYKAEHETLEQIVAIKALPAKFSSNEEIRARFVREAKIQAKISHPNIVKIHNFFELDGNYYIVMEYVEGETLEKIIKNTGLLPPNRCISLIGQIFDGISYAHKKGIIHRDIKPGNIMITAQSAVKILDFGIAKLSDEFNLTRAGVKVGTICYMSPEQIKGKSAAITSDIYSLGVTLFEMMTGKVPFSAASEYEVMKKIIESPPTSPKVHYPYIPAAIEYAILKALAKEPAKRFQSVDEFARALTEQADNQPVVHRPDFLELLHIFARRVSGSAVRIQQMSNPLKWGFLSGLLILLVVLSLSAFFAGPTQEEPPEVIESPGYSDPAKPEVINEKYPPATVIPALLEEGHTFMDNRQYEEAITIYQQVLNSEPGNREAQTRIAQAREAIKALAHAQELRSKLSVAKEHSLKCQKGHIAACNKAIACYQDVLQADAANREAQKGVRDTEGKRKALKDLGIKF